MPTPRSRMVIVTASPCRRAVISMGCAARLYLMALASRLSTTRSSRARSPSTSRPSGASTTMGAAPPALLVRGAHLAHQRSHIQRLASQFQFLATLEPGHVQQLVYHRLHAGGPGEHPRDTLAEPLRRRRGVALEAPLHQVGLALNTGQGPTQVMRNDVEHLGARTRGRLGRGSGLLSRLRLLPG